jgi:Protein of unknown function (DUF2586)
MPAPDVRVTFLDGQLGQVPPSIAKLVCKMGIALGGTPNTLYSFSDPTTAQATLSGGPLLEVITDSLAAGGAPVLAMPLNPSTAGSTGSVVHTGPGTGTVAFTPAPAVTLDVKIQTGGALGTATFSYRLNGGAYSAPVATVGPGSPFSYRIPGTLTTITLADQVYTAAAVWTISTLGVISLVGTGTVGWVTQVSSPVDNYDMLVTITTAGALGVAVFTWSLDGGNTSTTGVLVPSGGKYAIPGSGVFLTFAGTFTALDTYESIAATAAFTNSDVTNAFTAFRAQAVDVGGFHINGMGANAAAAASLAGVVDAQLMAMEAEFRYSYGIVECPTVEADSALNTAFASFVSTRVAVCAGDIGHRSLLTGRVIRRNSAVPIASRAAAIRPGKKVSWVRLGGLPRVASLYPNGTATTWSPDLLDANRFMVLRVFKGRAGYFVQRDNMMANPGSDYSSLTNRRVVDAGASVARQALLPFVNEDLLVDSTGKLQATEVTRVQNAVKSPVKDELIGNGDASGVTVTVDPSSNIISTATLPVTLGIQPKGYASYINVNVGLVNPAIALAA